MECLGRTFHSELTVVFPSWFRRGIVSPLRMSWFTLTTVYHNFPNPSVSFILVKKKRKQKRKEKIYIPGEVDYLKAVPSAVTVFTLVSSLGVLRQILVNSALGSEVST